MSKGRRTATARIPRPSPAATAPTETLRRALSLVQAGQPEAAHTLCRSLLQRHPSHSGALSLLGIILAQAGRTAEAAEQFARAVAAAPHDVHALNHYGSTLRDLGRHREALGCYERALALRPDFADAHYNRGVTWHFMGEYLEAFGCYEQTLSRQPGHAQAWNNRGTVLRQLGRLEPALESYERALQAKPDHADAHNNRGATLHDLGRYEEAVGAYERALHLRPGRAETLNNLGAALYRLGRHEEALRHIEQALALRADYLEARNNHGLVLHKLERHEEAIAEFRRALALDPDSPAAHSNLGVTLAALQQHEEALASYARALEAESGFADAHFNRGVTLQALQRVPEALASFEQALTFGRRDADTFRNHGAALLLTKSPEEAIASYEQALLLDPDSNFVRGEQRHARMQICDWHGFEADIAEITAGVQRGAAVVPPFTLLALLDSLPLQRQAAQIWARERCTTRRPLPPPPPRRRNDKIRVAYFSADFRNHAVAALSAELFEMHDRSQFELTAFSLGPDVRDTLRMRLEGAFDRFLPVGNQSDHQISQQARELGIDIAVDLGGYTLEARPRIKALRPAPVQVSYLGYLGTLGAPFMDYLIADPVLVPEHARAHYTEKIAYLPSYQVNDSKRPLPSGPNTRAAFGLPEHGFVFCCFNASYKIVPQTFDSWMRILVAVPGSVLFLLAGTAATARNLRLQALKRGIDPHRLVFGGPLPGGEYLARYQAADLFLDTLPYNAGTTASDALWANLPVLTCRGEAFAARMAASILTSAGLEALITDSPADYERRAIELATDAPQLAALRQRLADSRNASSLFNTANFTRSLESLYRQMHERHLAGLPPAHLSADGPLAAPHDSVISETDP